MRHENCVTNENTTAVWMGLQLLLRWHENSVFKVQDRLFYSLPRGVVMKRILITVLTIGLPIFLWIGSANAATILETPEPSTIYLLGAGVVALVGWGLRKKK
jgi:hypothetical protein